MDKMCNFAHQNKDSCLGKNVRNKNFKRNVQKSFLW